MFNFKSLGAFFLLLLVVSDPVFASATGSSMPWESPLQLVMTSITGPVAGVIALIGISVAGGMLIFGGELGEFARRIVMLVLVLALLVGAANLLGVLFTGAGAVI